MSRWPKDTQAARNAFYGNYTLDSLDVLGYVYARN